MRLNAAAMHLDQPLDQGQSDAQSAVRAVERALGLREEIEYSRQQVARDPDAGITHAQDDLVVGALSQHVDTAARRSELRGVVYEIGDHLAHARRVGLDHALPQRPTISSPTTDADRVRPDIAFLRPPA